MKQLRLTPIEQLPPRGGFIRLEKNDLYALARRCSGLMLAMVLHIMGETTCHEDRPEFAEISGEDWQQLTGATERAIELAASRCESLGFIEREFPERTRHRGGFKVCRENFAKPDLPKPRVRECKPPAKDPKLDSDLQSGSASVPAPTPIAAYRQQPSNDPKLDSDVYGTFAVSSQDPKLISVVPGPKTFAASAGAQFDAAEFSVVERNPFRTGPQPDSVLSETYCPWSWPCPYLVKNEEGRSQSSSSFEDTATTTTVVRTPEPMDFHRELVRRFHDAGKHTPLPSQSAPIGAALGEHRQLFIDWLTPDKMRRVQHPGVLPSLLKEFQDWVATLPQAEPEPKPMAICPKCSGTGIRGGRQWSTLQDLAAIKPEECCECLSGSQTLELVTARAKAAGGGD